MQCLSPGARLFAVVILLGMSLARAEPESRLMAMKITLGKLIFNDVSLSEPAGQSCNSCHQSEKFYNDPGNMVSPGADRALFGNRNAPMISYIKFNPVLSWDKEEQHWLGGFFLDGREPTLMEQTLQPFLNPVEMGNASVSALLAKIKAAPYKGIIENIYGVAIWESDGAAINAISDAIVSYERGPEFAPFSSRYDYYLRGELELSAQEAKGLELFEDEDRANCVACHPTQRGENNTPPLLTDFTYDNLGLPMNEELPFLRMPKRYNPDGLQYVDKGLADNPHINNPAEELGKFKVPTLRNIAKSAPYMHNGIFSTLEEVMDFYNSRDVDDKWPAAEIAATVNHDELGDLQLTEDEMAALVAFMHTLSDGYQL